MTRHSWRSAWTSRAVLLSADDVDTDQIIPARFLKATERSGLGRHLFADHRGPGCPLDEPRARGRRILVAGRNFGCGSSREHAPWALTDFGFAAVIARSFGDIFRANALKNGLLPVALDPEPWSLLVDRLRRDADVDLTVDLPAARVSMDGWTAPIAIDPFARHCLIEEVDELGFLLALEPAIAEFEARSEQ